MKSRIHKRLREKLAPFIPQIEAMKVVVAGQDGARFPAELKALLPTVTVVYVPHKGQSVQAYRALESAQLVIRRAHVHRHLQGVTCPEIKSRGVNIGRFVDAIVDYFHHFNKEAI